MIATARLSSYQPLPLPGWKTASGGLQPWGRRRVGRTGPQPTGALRKNQPRYDLARRGAVLPQNEQKKLSPCMVGFLNRATSGTDWGAVRFTEGSTWGGRRASTSLNLVTYSDWRHSRDFSLLLHELGHMPDWQSGELTNFSYARESASAWWNDRDTWAGNRFEQNARR